MSAAAASRSRGRRLLAAGLLSVGIGAGCLLQWTAGSGVETLTPSPAAAVTAAAVAPSRVHRASVARRVRVPRPMSLRIPSLAISTHLVRLGLRPDRTVMVPNDPDTAGWYHLGTFPGALGSAVILGHVDSLQGPAVFYRLAQAQVGKRVFVRRDNGTTAIFVVRSVATYANGDFPAWRVYGPHGHRDLNLVTCGGKYDADAGGYQSNVVVNTRWVSTGPAAT